MLGGVVSTRARLRFPGFFDHAPIRLDTLCFFSQLQHLPNFLASPQGSTPVARAARERMAKRLEGNRGKRQYARRKGMVEPAFGWVKEVLGFRQFSLRGLKKVQGEWSLVTLALNLRRMARMEAVAAAA